MALGSWLNSDSEDTRAKGLIHIDMSAYGNLVCVVGSSIAEDGSNEVEPLDVVKICTFCLGVK